MNRFKTSDKGGLGKFKLSVLDTSKPTIGPDGTQKRIRGALQYAAICDCWTRADAKLIAEALNDYHDERLV